MYSIEAPHGVRLTGPVTDLAAAGVANAAAIFQIANYGGVAGVMIGVKTYRILHIWGVNAAGANTLLHIGTGAGAGFVALVPPIQTLNGLNFDFHPSEYIEFAADLTAYPVAATVTVQVEVLEIG